MLLSIRYDANILTRTLYYEAEKATGIPVEHQMLTNGQSFLRPDVKLGEFHLKDGCYIHLSVKGLGGGGQSDSGTIAVIVRHYVTF